MGGTIIIDELLEAQCGQVCKLKTPGEPSHTKGLSLLIVLPLGALPYSYSEDQKKKSPCAFSRARKNGNILKYAKPLYFLNKVFSQEKLFCMQAY